LKQAQCDGEKCLDAASRLKIVAAKPTRTRTSRSDITFEEDPLAASSLCSCEDETERTGKKAQRRSGRACEIAADANEHHNDAVSKRANK
jgi:hypothetical protein